jgi:hypothetical protein
MQQIAIGGDTRLQIGVTYPRRLDGHRGLRHLVQVSGSIRF